MTVLWWWYDGTCFYLIWECTFDSYVFRLVRTLALVAYHTHTATFKHIPTLNTNLVRLGWVNIKMPFYQYIYRKCHCGEKWKSYDRIISIMGFLYSLDDIFMVTAHKAGRLCQFCCCCCCLYCHFTWVYPAIFNIIHITKQQICKITKGGRKPQNVYETLSYRAMRFDQEKSQQKVQAQQV